MSENIEIWRDVLGWEGFYQVSNHGRVKSLDRIVPSKRHGTSYTVRGQIMGLERNGAYQHVTLSRSGRYKTVLVHRMVLEAFVGPCPEGMEGCHNDGVGTNNCLDNLRWGTPKENQQDRFLHGTSNRGKHYNLGHTWNRGTKCGTARLTEDNVRKIRKLYASGGHSQRGLGRMFGVSHMRIADVLYGKSFVDVL